jgi:3-oxoacyl-[acyl-carrier-protein] synthase-1
VSGVALDLSIVGQGLCCPVGVTAPSACIAMSAGITAFEELDYVDERSEPIYGARLALVEEGRPELRCAELLRRALRHVRPAMTQQELATLPMILVTSRIHPGLGAALAKAMPRPLVANLVGGPGTDLLALHEAAAWLAASGERRIVVCAVDCLTTARSLRNLRETGRLRTSTNPQGVMPGEAAACLVLERGAKDAAGTIVALGVGDEPATFDNDEPMRALGLSEAMRAALAAGGCTLHDVDWRLTNVGDEWLFVKEQSLALARLLDSPKSKFPLWQHAEFIGELGVASGLVQIMWAAHEWARGTAPGERALCMCSDPEGPRSAVLVRGRVARARRARAW